MEPSDPSTQCAQPALSSNGLARQRTDLALERTLMAHQRTLMAWVRTSTSMISFGFAMYKFFQATAPEKRLAHQIISAREVSMGMALLGTLALVFAMWEHRLNVAELYRMGCPKKLDIAYPVAAVISVLGVVILMAIAIRI